MSRPIEHVSSPITVEVTPGALFLPPTEPIDITGLIDNTEPTDNTEQPTADTEPTAVTGLITGEARHSSRP